MLNLGPEHRKSRSRSGGLLSTRHEAAGAGVGEGARRRWAVMER